MAWVTRNLTTGKGTAGGMERDWREAPRVAAVRRRERSFHLLLPDAGSLCVSFLFWRWKLGRGVAVRWYFSLFVALDGTNLQEYWLRDTGSLEMTITNFNPATFNVTSQVVYTCPLTSGLLMSSPARPRSLVSHSRYNKNNLKADKWVVANKYRHIFLLSSSRYVAVTRWARTIRCTLRCWRDCTWKPGSTSDCVTTRPAPVRTSLVWPVGPTSGSYTSPTLRVSHVLVLLKFCCMREICSASWHQVSFVKVAI